MTVRQGWLIDETITNKDSSTKKKSTVKYHGSFHYLFGCCKKTLFTYKPAALKRLKKNNCIYIRLTKITEQERCTYKLEIKIKIFSDI